MSKFQEGFYLTLIITGAIICLSPLAAINYLEFQATHNRAASMGNVLLILIPMTDLLLDFPSHFMSYFYPEQRTSNRQVKISVVIRLTDVERLLFMLGIAIRSTTYYMPRETSASVMFIIDDCTDNCSVLLTLGPILMFLHRCTTSFTHFRTSSLLITQIVGQTLMTMEYYCGSDRNLRGKLSIAGRSFNYISGLLYVLLISPCAMTYLKQKLGTSSARKTTISWISSLIKMSSKSIDLNNVKTEDNDCELYTNYIPALHMLSVFLIGFFNTLEVIYEDYDDLEHPTLSVIRNYVTLLAEVMVLVIELRIRKNEVTRGLVSYILRFFYFLTAEHLTQYKRIHMSLIFHITLICRSPFSLRRSRTYGTSPTSFEHL